MLPRPPKPTLFPYTTLFRSRRGVADRGMRHEQPPVEPWAAAQPAEHRDRHRLRHRRAGVRAGMTEVEQRGAGLRSEEHTSELQSQSNLVCRLLLEKKNKKKQ